MQTKATKMQSLTSPCTTGLALTVRSIDTEQGLVNRPGTRAALKCWASRLISVLVSVCPPLRALPWQTEDR
jgi:hypothetical protein